MVHVDLYFFDDVDIVLLNVELAADDLPLPQAQELLYRFGRGYPAGWDAAGQPLHCMAGVEWLDADGPCAGALRRAGRARPFSPMSASTARRASPRTGRSCSSRWCPTTPSREGALRYRQIEYYRMPMMAYLAVDEPRALTRNDFIRLGLRHRRRGDSDAAASASSTWPTSSSATATTASGPTSARRRTRATCAAAMRWWWWATRGAEFYRCAERGVLAQFRHQHFLLFLIAHFQKAALLMFSDRLVEALKRLDIADPESVRRFKRAIRSGFAGFLRFTHRYWFHEVSEQAQVRALFRMCTTHLGLDPLYAEVKERIADMNSYLDADSLRRQANTVVRLTVVTIFGLIGTVTTGFLGMNLLAEAERAAGRSALLVFGVVFVAIAWLTIYTMGKSKRLSDFLDVLSDEGAAVAHAPGCAGARVAPAASQVKRSVRRDARPTAT